MRKTAGNVQLQFGCQKRLKDSWVDFVVLFSVFSLMVLF